jgi:hypothetical protein
MLPRSHTAGSRPISIKTYTRKCSATIKHMRRKQKMLSSMNSREPGVHQYDIRPSGKV